MALPGLSTDAGVKKRRLRVDDGGHGHREGSAVADLDKIK